MTSSILQGLDETLLGMFGLPYLLSRSDLLLRKRLDWILKHLPAGRYEVLDVGCGNGAISFACALRGHEVTGLDVPSFAERCRSRARILGLQSKCSFRGCDVRKLNRLGLRGRFDYVICSEVIEHVFDDRSFLRNIARCAKPAGRILLTTPNSGSPRPMIEKLSTKEDGGHVRWGYTPDELRQLYASCGLKPGEIAGIGGPVTLKAVNFHNRLQLAGLPAPLQSAAAVFLIPLTYLDDGRKSAYCWGIEAGRV